MEPITCKTLSGTTVTLEGADRNDEGLPFFYYARTKRGVLVQVRPHALALMTIPEQHPLHLEVAEAIKQHALVPVKTAARDHFAASLLHLAELPLDSLRALFAEQIRHPGKRLCRQVMEVALAYRALEKFYVDHEVSVPESVIRNVQIACNAHSAQVLLDAKVVSERKGVRMSENITSECPGFKTQFSATEPDCVECAVTFPAEHAACKQAVEAKQAKRENAMNAEQKSDVTQPASTVTTPPQAEQPVTPGETKPREKKEKTVETTPFKGFKAGSKAQVLFDIVKGAPNGQTTAAAVQEALKAQGAAKDDATAKFLVDSYVGEWATGAWGNVVRNFAFVITFDKKGGLITYTAKA